MKLHLTFRLKTVLGIAAIQALLLFVIGYSSMGFLRESNRASLNDHVQTTAALFATMTRSAVLSSDLASLESFVRQTSKNPKVRYARVVGNQGVLAQAGDPEALARPFVEDRRFEDVQDGTFDTRIFIKEAGQIFGQIQIGLAADHIAVIIEAAQERIIFLSALLMALTAVFSSILGHFLTRQLDALVTGAKRISDGEIGYQVRVMGRDELAHTAAMFNRMSAQMAATVEDLNRALDEAHRAGRELREKEARLRAVLEGVIDAVVSIDENGRVESFNPAAERMFGYSAEEVLGRSVGCLTPEPHRSRHDDYVRRYLETGQGRVIGVGRETMGRHKDGTTFPVDLAVSEVWLSDRRLFTGIVRDITARKQSEAELHRYQEGLEQMVAERTQELRTAQAELVSRAMESGRAQWSAMVLHNIGNAVTPAKVGIESLRLDRIQSALGYLRLSCRELAAHRGDLDRFANLDPRGRQVFDYLMSLADEFERMGRQQLEALAAVKQALGHVAEILTLQQSYAAREQEVRETVDLNRIIEDALRMQSSALQKRGITVARALAPDLPRLVIDKNRLLQVLVNFIKNAYEAIDQAGEGRRQIAVATFHDGGRVGFQLADSGVGIAPERLGTLFEFGASGKGSSGIGLYYCKMFVEANRGTLSITSPGPGQGATVEVAFGTEHAAPSAA